MEKDDKGSTLIRIGVSGWEFLLVPAYPGCPGSKAVKRSLLLLLLYCSYTLMYTDVYRNFHKSKCKEVTMFTRKLLEIFMSHVISMTDYNALYNSFTNRMQNFTENNTCVSINTELKK